MHYTGWSFADVYLLPMCSSCLHPLAMSWLCQTWQRLLWKSRHLHQDLVFFCLWFYCCAWKSALIFLCFIVRHTKPLSRGSRGTRDPLAAGFRSKFLVGSVLAYRWACLTLTGLHFKLHLNSVLEGAVTHCLLTETTRKPDSFSICVSKRRRFTHKRVNYFDL